MEAVELFMKVEIFPNVMKKKTKLIVFHIFTLRLQTIQPEDFLPSTLSSITHHYL